MEFKITLIEYQTNFPGLKKHFIIFQNCLKLNKRPEHSQYCEYGRFINQI